MFNRGLRWMTCAVLVMAPCFGGIFAGSGVASPPSYIDFANSGFFSWDTSGLSLVDTPDGMKWTGTIIGTSNSDFPSEAFGRVVLMGTRDLNVSAGTVVNLRSQLTNITFSHSSSIAITQLDATAFLDRVPGFVNLCYADTLVWNNNSAIGSPVNAGPNTASCATDTAASGLRFYTGFNFFVSGSGTHTLTVNLGNSATGEAFEDGVPEPGTVGIVFVGLGLLGMWRRRMQ